MRNGSFQKRNPYGSKARHTLQAKNIPGTYETGVPVEWHLVGYLHNYPSTTTKIKKIEIKTTRYTTIPPHVRRNHADQVKPLSSSNTSRQSNVSYVLHHPFS